MMKLSEAGQKVFDARYAAKDDKGNIIESFERAVYRIAKAAASAEKENQKKWEERFAYVIGDLLFVPSTPIWANVGKDDRPWQPSACFVLSVDDNLESMYQTLKDTAMVFKSGGGVGYNFSSIRPKSDLVHTTKGQASGVVELIRLYDASANMVKQGGVRRGAAMGILNIDHPEICDFICAKLDGGLTNFNLSVGIWNRFMDALEDGSAWQLIFNGKHYRDVTPDEIWNMIIEAAWTCADPGLIFLDHIQRDNPVPGNLLVSTNPCVTADTWVATKDGPRQVFQLVGHQFEAVVNGKIFKTGDAGFFKTGVKPVIKITTQQGYSVKLTADHRVQRIVEKTRYRIGNEWVPAGNLVPGDQIILNDHRAHVCWPGSLTEGEGYLLGLLVGDGTLKDDSAILSVWAKNLAVNGSGDDGAYSVMDVAKNYAMALRHRSDFSGCVPVSGRNEYRLKLASIKALATKMEMCRDHKTITPEIEQASSEGYCGFLRGLFDADGTVLGEQEKGVSLRLSQSSYELLMAVQRMLLRLGIASTIYRYRRPAGKKLLPDGKGGRRKYAIKAQHELSISGDSISLFAGRIGFGDREKATKLETILSNYVRKLNRERFVATVASLEESGEEEVFDVQVPEINAFDANGLVVHNCGEQPLSPGESCLLGSVNLARMFRGNVLDMIDQKLLEETVATGVRFLDNLIDVAQYPLSSIAEATRATRKIGVGFTGLADALIKVGHPYDSEEGRQFTERLVSLIQQAAYDASEKLAEEKGCFPLWNMSIFYPNTKRRNASCITIAPTGSVTTMAGCEGYGIEPIFAVAYSKFTNVASDFEVFSPLFLAACKEQVPKEVLSEVAQKGTCQGVEGIPEKIARIFKGAQEISPEDHILMQATVQKYVDNAISKTINLPGSATVEDICKCYKMAYELGLKGITVFREGSKDGTVTVGKSKERRPGCVRQPQCDPL